MTKGTAFVSLRRLHFPDTIVAEIPFKQQGMEYVPKGFAPGDTSDGWHSLDELYEHRTVLFASLCNAMQDLMRVTGHDGCAFKSHRHSDGTMYDGMFIAGLKTCHGWVTYHCEEKYWDMFDVTELEQAPEWDGASPVDGLFRLVEDFTHGHWHGELIGT